MKKILFFVIFFYFLALFQTSFLVHFNISGIIPNLILISLILLNLFEDSKKNDGIIAAIPAGFFWDIFSNRPIGFHILILAGAAVLIKVILRNYLQPVIRLRK